MKQLVLKLGLVAALVTVSSTFVWCQGTATGSISGSVFDPSGGVIPGAEILVKNSATGGEFTTMSAENGTFMVPALASGMYSVTVTMPGFKQVVVNDVKVDVATPASVKITLQVGEPTESVIVMGGAQVLQTQTANVATTITGRQITDLPFVSRDALDLVLLLPGTATPGRPRTSSVNGLPKGSLNITIDGLNVQDNLLKSSDGFFTYIRPRLDAIEEVTLSTATPGAESGAEGAVQIKFVTRGGDNEYHGSLYEYHRNPALNANFWYNNRDKTPDPKTGKAPRDRILLNQYGVRVGGPIRIPGLFDGRDRAFFFVNYEEYRLPEQYTRDRTILTPEAQSGIFRYGTQSVNLFTLAAGNNQTATPDPTTAALLAAIRGSTSKTGSVRAHSDPNFQYYTFTNTGGQTRRFPTVRFDLNVTDKHHIENVWNYQAFGSKVDFLNTADPAFPDFDNFGSQGGPRWSNVTALRSTLTPTLVNEARFGLQGGLTVWYPEVGPASFGLGGGYAVSITGPGISQWYAVNSPQRRNSPVKQFNDTVSWIKGTHTLNFGFNFSQVNLFNNTGNAAVTIGLGVDSTDPANAMFSAANFPGSSASDRTRAANIYALLTGRVTSIGATAYLDEKTGKYLYMGRRIQRAQMRESGFFAQDSWRWKPNLTVNYGLRWEVQFPFTALNSAYSTTTFAELWGISGAGNTFKPGTLTGKETQFVSFEAGQKAYDTDYNNLAPSLGFAWSPNWNNSVLRKIFGSGTQSVIRGGYSIAFNREGTNVFTAILGSNPGGSLTATRNMTNGNLVGGSLGNLPLLFRDKNRLGPPTFTDTPAYPLTGLVGDSVNTFDPKLRLGYIQSWSFGIQRELTKDTVFEARYVGNKGTGLWRQYNINETNLIENKFADEFKLAMANLQANNAAGGSRNGSFAYFGPGSGTSPLPFMLAFFSGKPGSQAGDAALYTSSNFKSSTLVNYLFPDYPRPIDFANTLVGNAGMRANSATAGLPANFFRVNPGKLGGAYIVDNGGASNYHGLAFELRRRMSRG
ncbi:MAG: carboxypeptidase regulatory-like domain-containing protein, partial [Acidobacteria bacterium]